MKCKKNKNKKKNKIKKQTKKLEIKRKKKLSRLDLRIFISKLKGGCRNKRQ